MKKYILQHFGIILKKSISCTIIVCFSLTMILPPSYAQMLMNPAPSALAMMPQAGTMVSLSKPFVPVIMKGIKIFPKDPLKFDFIIDLGDTDLADEALENETTKLVKYFLASLTTPEEDMWVNLSPYEKDRIISESFGMTEMGRDLLAQDYMLKQITASLMYPEEGFGKEFWERVYKKSKDLYGTIDISVDTFNKVWIMPEKAVVYNEGTATYITESRLKVMIEEDYFAMQNNLQTPDIRHRTQKKQNIISDSQGVIDEIIREVILPELEREVNEGKNFANLRQVYHAMILATWFKRNLKNSIINKIYTAQNKIDVKDKNIKEKIYQQYIEAFKTGVYNYIKEDYDP